MEPRKIDSIPEWSRRFDPLGQHSGLKRTKLFLFHGSWVLLFLICLRLEVRVSDALLQLLGTMVSVFSALLIAVLIPLLELRRREAQKENGNTFLMLFLGLAVSNARLGLFVAGSSFCLMIILLLEGAGIQIVTQILSGACLTLLAVFATTIVFVICDVVTAYTVTADS